MPSPLEELIIRLANRDAPRTEAMVQADVRQLLLTADLNLSDDKLVMLEAQLGDHRRIDVEVGATVIEVKKDLRVGNLRVIAVEQLQGYVESRQKEFGRRYVGVLTDGAEWLCYQLQVNELVKVSEFTTTPSKPATDAFLVWLEGVLATTRGLKPTPDVIRTRLGAGSSSHSLDRATLAALYAQNRDAAAVRTKRRLWARLLKTALGTQFEDTDDLFVEHTLLVNTADIIAHAVVGLPVDNIAPASLLSGAKFDEKGIYGVVDADFFDWAVHVPGGDVFVRTLARRLGRFDWSAVKHDVLKVLYESVIPAETRKRLGEYYTPDWLAEKVVEKTVVDPLNERVLDPACGSGTFLFHAVRRYLDEAKRTGLSAAATLDGVTTHVIGMDLHPVAVTLARVTYLLALGTDILAAEDRGAITVPVYLGDSLQWHQNENLWSDRELKIVADDDRPLFPDIFVFPSSLLRDTRVFDELVKKLAARASAPTRKPGSKAPSLTGVFQQLAIPVDAQKTITATFETMCRLHDEGRDHIWGYYIRNQARPEWLARPENRVDILVGNPPWLSYRFMPEAMQKDFRAMSEVRGLWSGGKVATHQDLSGLFVARSVQLYLNTGGRFGFVMPNAVRDREQFAGFRAANYEHGRAEVRVAFSIPWDLRRIRPHFFPRGAAVVFGTRGSKAGPMPSQAEYWSGRIARPDPSWTDVAGTISRDLVEAETAETEEGSPYRARFRQGATIVPRVLFMVQKEKAGPLGQVAGRATVRSVRSSLEKKPWKDVPGLEGIVETEFLRSIYLGESVLPYRVLAPSFGIIPRDTDGLLESCDERIEHYAGLAEWWRRAEECWNLHRTPATLLTLKQRLNYHGELENQFPIQPERIVYPKSGMHVAAARLTGRRGVLDHTLYWASAASVEEAHYVCAIINSAAMTQLVRPLMSYGKDERHIDKHIWRLPIPLYDASEPLHAELAALGRKAETEVAALAVDLGKHFAAARRAVRQSLEQSEVGRRIEEIVPEVVKDEG